MKDLFSKIATAVTEIKDGWTSVEKAQSIAALIVALRPKASLEIGVYAGKGLVAMALAHEAIGYGVAFGIDPYSAIESTQGQSNPEDFEFWKRLDHEHFYNECKKHLKRFVASEVHHQLIRTTSQQFPPPKEIGVLRIDGNHGERAFHDTVKFAPFVAVGGFLILDDINWTGGHVQRAAQRLKQTGWQELYPLDDGIVFQRRH